jgi:hypothetical protein
LGARSIGIGRCAGVAASATSNGTVAARSASAANTRSAIATRATGRVTSERVYINASQFPSIARDGNIAASATRCRVTGATIAASAVAAAATRPAITAIAA